MFAKTKDGVPAVAMREISLLKGLTNKHVVKLLDVYSSPANLYLDPWLPHRANESSCRLFSASLQSIAVVFSCNSKVFERMEMDLRMYLKRHGKMEGSMLRTASFDV